MGGACTVDKWQVLAKDYVIQNWPYQTVRRDRCRLPNGQEIDAYINEYPDWVNAVVLTPKQEMVLVRQYRHGVSDFILEIPGGIMEAAETPEAAIVREVAEETGYQSGQAPIWLGSFFSNPAASTNRVHSYLLLNAEPVVMQHLDDTEDIQVEYWPFGEFGDKIRRGEASQSFSALAYYLAKEVLDPLR